MKKLILWGALALCFSASAAVTKLDVPFAPTDEIQAEVNTSAGWNEVYKVDGEGQAAAIKALVEKGSPPPAIAVAVSGRLHFSQAGADASLGEVTLEVTRKGKAIEYDDNCATVPATGDVLQWVYRSADGVDEVTTKTTVREHHAFGIVGETAREPIRLNLTKKEHCDAVTESRILSAGTLTFKHNGKVAFREAVLLQTISAP